MFLDCLCAFMAIASVDKERTTRWLPPPAPLFFFLMTFHCQLGTRSQRQHGKCAGCDTFSQRARASHRSLTRPRSWGAKANMGKILRTFHHFPFAGIFEESDPIVQVAWTHSGQIINRCWEIKKKRKERNTAANEKIEVTSLGRLSCICKLGGKGRCQRKCLNTRTLHAGNINMPVFYMVTFSHSCRPPCHARCAQAGAHACVSSLRVPSLLISPSLAHFACSLHPSLVCFF